MLTTFNHDLLKKVITGDKSWVYGYDIETKAQSSQWKRPEQPRINVMVLFTIFFDCKGVVHHEFVSDHTVNNEYYFEAVHRLPKAICQKRTELWKNNHEFCIIYYTSMLVREFLVKNNTVIRPQSPFSPDLACADSFFYQKLKTPMKKKNK